MNDEQILFFFIFILLWQNEFTGKEETIKRFRDFRNGQEISATRGLQ